MLTPSERVCKNMHVVYKEGPNGKAEKERGTKHVTNQTGQERYTC